MASLFYALDNPIRREIIEMLKWKSMSAGEIASHFDISAPSVSRHLDVLKKADIIVAERRGTTLIYSLNLSVLQESLIEIIKLLRVEDKEEKPRPQGSGGESCVL